MYEEMKIDEAKQILKLITTEQWWWEDELRKPCKVQILYETREWLNKNPKNIKTQLIKQAFKLFKNETDSSTLLF